MTPDGPRPASRSSLERRISWFAELAVLALWSERLIAAFWHVLMVVGVFLVLALFGVLTALPAWLHLVVLVAIAAALVLTVRRGRAAFVPPARQTALRRVERDSELAHRPFDALADRPAGDADETTQLLWRLHQERRRREIGRLSLSLPRPGLEERDPRALRYLLVMVAVVGLIIAGPRAGRMVTAALFPSFASSTTTVPIEAWIRPPAYTGLAPILLKNGDSATVAVPVGSTLEAHVTGGSRTPHLSYADTREDFKRVDGGGFAIKHTLSAPGTLSIRRGWFALSSWTIDIIPDKPPTVEFAKAPTAEPSGALKFYYRASDDYGVASVGLKVRREPGPPDIAADPIEVTLASGTNEKFVYGSNIQDLTGHPWAGLRVVARLVATDNAGQSSESAEFPMALPERRFLNGMAQNIVEIRKHIIFNDRPLPELALELSNITDHPQTFAEDLSVYLALRAAVDEMHSLADRDPDNLARVEDLMWNSALKIEDGNKPQADKDLRAAEDALEKALKDPNTPASEIARLTQNLKDAINRDIQAMAENLKKQQDSPDSPLDPNTQTMDQHELNDQVDKMGEMAKDGSRDAAQDMLDYIKNLLENMKTSKQNAQANKEGKEALDKLKDLAKKQRDMENGDDPSSAQDQEALRKSLGDAAQQIGDAMGDIPQSVGGADKAMRNAEKALRRGAKGGAKGDQEEAAGQLDQAAQSLSDQLSQGGTELRGGQSNRDPLGRLDGPDSNSRNIGPGNKILPTQREMIRSRAILDELRHRADDLNRPRQELDYLHRLINGF
jgi:uncharacterized protein (TIGR02302 family)